MNPEKSLAHSWAVYGKTAMTPARTRWAAEKDSLSMWPWNRRWRKHHQPERPRARTGWKISPSICDEDRAAAAAAELCRNHQHLEVGGQKKKMAATDATSAMSATISRRTMLDLPSLPACAGTGSGEPLSGPHMAQISMVIGGI